MDMVSRNELSRLIIESLEGTITSERLSRLDQLLSEDREAVAYYTHHLKLYSLLVTRGNQLFVNQEADYQGIDYTGFLKELAICEKTAPTIELPVEKPPQELIQKVVYPPREKRKMTKFQIFTFIASAAALLFMVAFPKLFPLIPRGIGVATLIDQVGVEWGNTDSIGTLQTGARLWNHEGSLWLKKGTVKIQFDYGAKVILEGPAEFELIDAEKMILNSGRLYATVPESAAGFTTVTPSSTVIDLGTEFGVKVYVDGRADVHMFKGKASLIPGQGGKKENGISLFAGQAKQVNTYGQVHDIALSEESFLAPDQFEIMSKADKGSAYHRWLVYSRQLRRDPSLVAYYTFEKDEQDIDVLRNKAALTGGRLDGKLRGLVQGKPPAWTSGRWPQKTALNFDRSEHQVVVIPSDPALHINGPITIAAWVKCEDSLGGGHLVACRLPDLGVANFQVGYVNPESDFAWGRGIQFGRMDANENDERSDRVYSKQMLEYSSDWRFIAVSHDNKTVRFYVDGKLSESRKFEFYQQSVIADMTIGSLWDSGSVGLDRFGFSGDLGELAIFKRVLTDEEIGEMYEAGAPL